MDRSLRDMPFGRLVQEDAELAALRREYATESAEHRRAAAMFSYDASAAGEMFGQAVLRATGDREWLDREKPGAGAVAALAIDPTCAPAMLTVGSMEYQLGRADEALELFLGLAAPPEDTEDLAEIIDKAGGFLAEEGNYVHGEKLYAEAARQHPDVALYHDGLGYCAGKLGKLQAAVDHSRRAVELSPRDHELLGNLGWALVEAGSYDEAEDVLKRAVDLSPKGHDRARHNLQECRRRRQAALDRKQWRPKDARDGE
ncbi:MAG TPA: tetratricopeptide repeat protein [Phycisphaerae bacterium]|nr:tetratricopeptide repeat protein [Phycisphaerae bacterium]